MLCCPSVRDAVRVSQNSRYVFRDGAAKLDTGPPEAIEGFEAEASDDL
jgi:hypothetical protein